MIKIIIIILNLYTLIDCDNISIDLKYLTDSYKKKFNKNTGNNKYIINLDKEVDILEISMENIEGDCKWYNYDIVINNLQYSDKVKQKTIIINVKANIYWQNLQKLYLIMLKISCYNLFIKNLNIEVGTDFILQGHKIVINDSTIKKDKTIPCCVFDNNNFILKNMYEKFIQNENKNEYINFFNFLTNEQIKEELKLFKNIILSDITIFNNSYFEFLCLYSVSNVLKFNNSTIKNISKCGTDYSKNLKFEFFQKICGNYGGSNYSSGGISLNIEGKANLNNKCFEIFQNNFIDKHPFKNFYFSGNKGDENANLKGNYNGGIINIYSQILIINEQSELNVSAINIDENSGSSGGSIKIFSQYNSIKGNLLANGSDSFNNISGEGAGGNIIITKYLLFKNNYKFIVDINKSQYNEYKNLIETDKNEDIKYKVFKGERRLEKVIKFNKYLAENGTFNTNYCDINRYGFNCIKCSKGTFNLGISNNFCLGCYSYYSSNKIYFNNNCLEYKCKKGIIDRKYNNFCLNFIDLMINRLKDILIITLSMYCIFILVIIIQYILNLTKINFFKKLYSKNKLNLIKDIDRTNQNQEKKPNEIYYIYGNNSPFYHDFIDISLINNKKNQKLYSYIIRNINLILKNKFKQKFLYWFFFIIFPIKNYFVKKLFKKKI